MGMVPFQHQVHGLHYSLRTCPVLNFCNDIHNNKCKQVSPLGKFQVFEILPKSRDKGDIWATEAPGSSISSAKDFI